jgi:hypothetical protein
MFRKIIEYTYIVISHIKQAGKRGLVYQVILLNKSLSEYSFSNQFIFIFFS